MRNSFKTVYATSGAKLLSCSLAFLPQILQPVDAHAASLYRKATVGEILGSSRKFDGTPVEVHGRILLTQENGTFEDGSTCASLKVCALWIEFDHCEMTGGSTQKSCAAYIDSLVT